jgi:protoheme IX farnesyltransferase
MMKLRIVFMVLITNAMGFVLGSRGEVGDWTRLAVVLLGTGLAAAGAAVLNNFLERDIDSQMDRTRSRVLPAGVVDPAHALAFGILLVLGGVTILVTRVNLLTGFLVLLTAFLYVLVYTPLKRVSWINTPVGAIPGALPPVSGWAAGAGELEPGAWILFFILFAWQHPHFYAIAWMCKEDYARAGFKMLPVVDPSGKAMFRQVIGFCSALIVISTLPTAIGMTGRLYLAGACALGLMYLHSGVLASRSRTEADARGLLRASVIYLPLLLALIMMDRIN